MTRTRGTSRTFHVVMNTLGLNDKRSNHCVIDRFELLNLSRGLFLPLQLPDTAQYKNTKFVKLALTSYTAKLIPNYLGQPY